MNQCEEVLQYIQEHGSITQKQATRYCGTIRLSARIYDLRQLGFDIKTENIKVRTRRGKKTTVARYSLND